MTALASWGLPFDNSTTTVAIADGSATATITVPVNDDVLLEGSETLSVTLTNASGGIALGATLTQTANITDDEVASADVQLTGFTDGAEPGTAATFTVTLSSTNNTGSAITVDYVYNNAGTDTATGGVGNDYDNSTTTVAIADGSATATIKIGRAHV